MNCPRLLRIAAPRLPGAGSLLPAAAAVAPAATAAARAPMATPTTTPRRARRGVHTIPEAKLQYATNELPGFLSPAGFKIAWTDYQKLLVTRLNTMISGTVLEQDTPRAILAKTARDPAKAHFFNHASMVFNNHFFFSGLSGNPAPMSAELKTEIEASFGSVDNLRREMSITALSMFGPGFVWLVRVLDKRLSKNAVESDLRLDLRILPTYLGGSPFAEAHWRRQSTDMNTAGEEQWRQGPLQGQSMAAYQTPSAPGGAVAGADIAAASSRERVAPGGASVTPLLCINTWEHVWLTDYGIGDGQNGGKLEYVKRWWHTINWSRVQSLAMGMSGQRPA